MLGLAVSSLPSLLLTAAEWEAEYIRTSVPNEDSQPYLRVGESADQVGEYVSKARASLGILREELAAYAPDAVVVIGCWRSEVSLQTATFTILHSDSEPSAPPNQQAEYQPRRPDLGSFLTEELVAKGFDLAWQQRPESLPESVLITLQALDISSNLQTIPILINTSNPPLPSAARCWELGAAIRESLAARPERIAIVAAGGLSYDQLGRWVDEPFDRWFLKALEAADAVALKTLFRIETEVLQGRTGETRSWIVVASACGTQAHVVDYFAARQSRSGVGFAVWRDT